jgi:hypothetical protein
MLSRNDTLELRQSEPTTQKRSVSKLGLAGNETRAGFRAQFCHNPKPSTSNRSKSVFFCIPCNVIRRNVQLHHDLPKKAHRAAFHRETYGKRTLQQVKNATTAIKGISIIEK